MSEEQTSSQKESISQEIRAQTDISQNLQSSQESFTQRRFYLLKDAWSFLKVRKKWWLLPIVLMMFLVGVLIVFGQSSAVSPFVYALF